MAFTFFYFAGERCEYDADKNVKVLKKHKLGFVDAVTMFSGQYTTQPVRNYPDQTKVTGLAKGKLYCLLTEDREDEDGPYTHLATLWKSSTEEEEDYEKQYR